MHFFFKKIGSEWRCWCADIQYVCAPTTPFTSERTDLSDSTVHGDSITRSVCTKLHLTFFPHVRQKSSLRGRGLTQRLSN